MSQTGQANEMNMSSLVHQYLLQVQEGQLYPERIPVNMMERVLDLGCGTGEWLFDLAKRYPRLHIFGADINEESLQQAKIRRNTSGMRLVELRTMDIRQPFPIPDQYFDFIHLRRCAQFIAPQLWPRLLEECARVLRPDGWLAIVELELCEISSPACLAVHRAMLQARARLGRSLDVVGTSLGVAQRLYAMLQQASLDEVAYDLHTIDLGYMSGNMARIFLHEIIRSAHLVKPLVVQQGVLESAEFDALIKQAALELQAPDLCGWAILVSAYGRRV